MKLSRYATLAGLLGSLFFNLPCVSASAVALPDQRHYEIVSPAEANGDVYAPTRGSDSLEDPHTELPFRAAADGGAVAYLGDPPTTGGGGQVGNGLGNQYLAVRTPSGWLANDIQPGGSESSTSYQAFSEDLTYGILGSDRENRIPATPSAPEGCNTIYLHTSADNAYHSLFTSTATPGTCGVPIFAGGTADGTQLLFQTRAALTAEATEAREHLRNLYDSTAGTPVLVNVLPSGLPEPEPDATFGSVSPNSGTEEFPADFGEILSTDGDRVFWTSLEAVRNEEGEPIEEHPRALYVREHPTAPQSPVLQGGSCTVLADACTIQLDATQGGASRGGGGRFWYSSPDGSRVFFTACSRLTASSTAVTGSPCVHSEGVPSTGNDLYEYDFLKPTGERLTDLTVDNSPGDPLGADVQGVVGANETGPPGAYVYFVANGVLNTQPNAEGKTPVVEQPNLYVAHGGVTTFIATLAQQDDNFIGKESNSGETGDWRASPGSRTAAVASDGRTVVFMSVRALTGYDNIGPEGPIPEVFTYNFEARTIVCASCPPSNAAPVRPLNVEETKFGAFLPISSQRTYSPRWMSETGSRVFFDTAQPLVGEDTNGRQDVYEWERDGTGSCGRASGCVYLLSGGDSTDNSAFVDASASGNDAFFTSRSALVAQKQTESVSLYDARVNGGFSEERSACTNSCSEPALLPPEFATPPTVSLEGVQETPLGSGSSAETGVRVRPSRATLLARALKVCRAKAPKRRRVCERAAKRRYPSIPARPSKR